MHVYPEYELVVEPEDCSLESLGAAMQHHDVEDAVQGEALDDVSANVMESVEAQATPAQQQYASFAARVASAPDQVGAALLGLRSDGNNMQHRLEHCF